MSGWREDKRWSDRFISEIGEICGRHLITAAPEVEDRQFNTDMIVLTMRDVRIACRVRRSDYAARYADEFTIRSDRPASGNETELAKIMSGYGDFMLYGFSDAAERRLAVWTLCDLSVFRLAVSRHVMTHGGAMPGTKRKNGDGSSSFFAFRLDEFPRELVVASKRTSVERHAVAMAVPA